MGKQSGGTRTKRPVSKQVTNEEYAISNILQVKSIDNKAISKNIGKVSVVGDFSNQQRSSALKTLSAMYERYNLPKIKYLVFSTKNKDKSIAGVATYDKITIYDSYGATKNGVHKFLVHEMCHQMTGQYLKNIPKDIRSKISLDFSTALKNVKKKDDNGNYWKTDIEEFCSETLRKGLSGVKMNQYEQSTFRLIDTYFRKK